MQRTGRLATAMEVEADTASGEAQQAITVRRGKQDGITQRMQLLTFCGRQIPLISLMHMQCL